MDQSEYQSSGAGVSQTDKLIAYLEKHRGEWMPLPTLVAVCGGYAIHSRASDARKLGYNVEQKSYRDFDTGKIHSYYRIPAQQEAAI